VPSRYVRGVLLVVGAVLVANPILVFPHATDPAFEYRAVELPSDGDRLPRAARGTDIAGIGCEYSQQDWGCVFDEAIEANGSVRFVQNYPTGVGRAASAGERFVGIEGQLHRRVVETDDETVTALLVPVSWGDVLENVSVERDDLSPRERRLLDERNLTTHRPIDWTDHRNPRGGIVVRSGGEYHLLWEVSGDRSPPDAEAEAAAMVILTARALGVVLGLTVFGVAIMLGDPRE
jgi:hypothetical protein